MQWHRAFAVIMETSVLLGGQMRGRGEWKYALEECGGQCVTTVGTTKMPEWYADSWELKWMYRGHVSFIFTYTMNISYKDTNVWKVCFYNVTWVFLFNASTALGIEASGNSTNLVTIELHLLAYRYYILRTTTSYQHMW